MSTISPYQPPVRVLHLSDDPTEEFLLVSELAIEGLECELRRVKDSEELRDAIEHDGYDVVIADLPLPFTSAEHLGAVQRRRPDLPVLFRCGLTGSRKVTEVDTTARAIVETLRLNPVRVPSAAERREMLRRLVDLQEAQLRLNQLDLLDFDCSLREITKVGAEQLAVRRVSFWELDEATSRLECRLLFDLERNEHLEHPGLSAGPLYLAALEKSMFVAADDAQRDPRTSEFGTYLREHGITSMLDAPVRRDGRIVGVLCHEHVGPRRVWTILDNCAAASNAGLVARALEVRERRLALERLAEAERFEVIGRLASRIAHDFNNLLTVVLGNAELELAKLGATDEQARISWTQVGEAAETGAAFIRQLLAYARHAPPAPRVVDLSQQLAAATPFLERLLGSQVRLRTVVDASPVHVRIDETQWRQLLLNLASNARDAMPRGGECEIHLALDVESPRAVVTMRDTGDGIPEEILPRIFRPFFTTKASKVGTGLGLATVREIVSAAGGTIDVASQAGQGTAFTIRLPLESPAPLTGGEPLSLNSRPSGAPTRVGTALLVAADPAMGDVLGRLLGSLGWRVVGCDHPTTALSSVDDGIDLVLADQVLPEIDGESLAARVQAMRPTMPILLVGDRAPTTSRRHLAFIAKPVSTEALSGALRGLLAGDGP